MAIDVWNGEFAIFAGTAESNIFYSERTIIKGTGPMSKSHYYHNLALEGRKAH
jgi:hypothetical protein